MVVTRMVVAFSRSANLLCNLPCTLQGLTCTYAIWSCRRLPDCLMSSLACAFVSPDVSLSPIPQITSPLLRPVAAILPAVTWKTKKSLNLVAYRKCVILMFCVWAFFVASPILCTRRFRLPPSKYFLQTVLGLCYSFLSWFAYVSRRWQTVLDVLNFAVVQSLKRPASDRDWRFSHVTLAFVWRSHRYSGGTLPVSMQADEVSRSWVHP